jgi:hypothetical protein
MTHDLADFWQLLETNFPLGGPRRHLQELLGAELVAALESASVLRHRQVAERYPCPRPGGDGCPRVVMERDDGTIVAVCGNEPAECVDLELAPTDLDVLAAVPEGLSEAIAKTLQIRPAVAALPGLRNAYRVGTFIPDAGIKHPIYLVARCSERDTAEAIDALRTHAAGQTFGVLVPTERFLPDEVRRQASAAGVPLVPMLDAVGLDESGLCALADPLTLFSSIGRPAVAAGKVSMVVARALVRGVSGAVGWRELDEAGYQSLVAATASYDIFADELTRTVARGKGTARRHTGNVQASHFKTIRAAIEAKANFDPGIGDDDGVSAKQIFQRARQAFDIKNGSSWSLFKTDKVGDHAVYRFDPAGSVSFAFVFAPAR